MFLNKECQGDELLEFPYEIRDVDPSVNSELLRKLQDKRGSGFIQVGPKKWFFPKIFVHHAKFYYNFKTRPDDVFVVSFPRSGTTWTQEMVWLLNNNLDYKTAQEIPLFGRKGERYIFLEINSLSNDQTNAMVGEKSRIDWQVLNNEKERRFIKTHLPLELLPPDLLQSGSKVIYVARNPKDMIVSHYHFVKCNPFYKFSGDFAEFWSLMQQNLVIWGPYWEHVKEAWNRRNESENFMFIFYEDMHKDLRGTVAKVANFFGKSYSSEQLDQLAEHLKFDNFKNNESVDLFNKLGLEDSENNKFVRKGKVGNWKECFDEKLEKETDDWIAENLRDSDLTFPIKL